MTPAMLISSLQPATAAALVDQDRRRFPAVGFSVISAPHVLYNSPPSIGFGIGGLGSLAVAARLGLVWALAFRSVVRRSLRPATNTLHRR